MSRDKKTEGRKERVERKRPLFTELRRIEDASRKERVEMKIILVTGS